MLNRCTVEALAEDSRSRAAAIKEGRWFFTKRVADAWFEFSEAARGESLEKFMHAYRGVRLAVRELADLTIFEAESQTDAAFATFLAKMEAGDASN